jgi:acyl carrier protein
MSEQELRQKLAAIFAGVAPEVELDDVEPDENLREAMDIDSFDFLKVLSKIDEDLGVAVPEADYPKLDTLAGLLTYVGERLPGQTP